MSKKTSYSENHIQALNHREHIRKRPAIYLGKVNIKGFMEMLKGLLSNTFLNTKPDYFQFEFSEKYSGKIIFKNIKGGLNDSWATEHILPSSPFWMEALVLNNLSSVFDIIFFDKNDNQIVEQKFQQGKLKRGKIENKKLNCHSLEITFKLDRQIWKEGFEWNENYITHQIRDFAYLYKNVKFEIKYKSDEVPYLMLYHFKNGLKDQINIELLNGLCQSHFMTYFEKEFNGFSLELSFAFRDNSVDAGFLKSYVNDHHTHEGGTHVKGLIKGFRIALKRYVQEKKLNKKYSFSKKKITSYLIAALHLKMNNAHFEGSTKNKLGNRDIVKPISDHVSVILFDQLLTYENLATSLLRNFEIHESNY
ncbi:MAG: hypothetical protein AB8F94_00625 [Saprospiraceae bacterium]